MLTRVTLVATPGGGRGSSILSIALFSIIVDDNQHNLSFSAAMLSPKAIIPIKIVYKYSKIGIN